MERQAKQVIQKGVGVRTIQKEKEMNQNKLVQIQQKHKTKGRLR